ncbi:MAG: 2Fe-2S ferredoxin [Candidatus Muiribacterium halophilum]|uniref:2Fe-2S ferredoxin n=1 Tax=Muiribacterium halophilum TaxID=2053465 RepID=A0A2N5ZFP9_MUIH1|nr:MAG: 2Fe-2S ferredoxin [Candidatus Muirbacterium halophilum]
MTTLNELKKLKEKAVKELKTREGKATAKITVGMGTCGIAAGARDVTSSIMEEIEKRNLADVIVSQSGCMGYCEQEPLVEVEKDGQKVIYKKVDAEGAKRIVAEHVVNGNIVGDMVFSSEK